MVKTRWNFGSHQEPWPLTFGSTTTAVNFSRLFLFPRLYGASTSKRQFGHLICCRTDPSRGQRSPLGSPIFAFCFCPVYTVFSGWISLLLLLSCRSWAPPLCCCGATREEFLLGPNSGRRSFWWRSWTPSPAEPSSGPVMFLTPVARSRFSSEHVLYVAAVKTLYSL